MTTKITFKALLRRKECRYGEAHLQHLLDERWENGLWKHVYFDHKDKPTFFFEDYIQWQEDRYKKICQARSKRMIVMHKGFFRRIWFKITEYIQSLEQIDMQA